MAAQSGTNHIIDDFENSFQACFAALTNPDHFNVHNSEETKTGVEQNILRFLDVAKQMECFFLQKRLLLSVQKPEHIVLESISDLKNELVRKEQLMNKYNEKIQTWQNILQDASGTQRPPQAAAPPAPQPPQNMQVMQGPPPQMPPQVVQQGGVPTHPPHHMMQGHCMPPMTSSPAPVGMQPGMVVPSGAMHPSHVGAPQQPGGLQGPLAYLERTMSNIGMPDGTR